MSDLNTTRPQKNRSGRKAIVTIIVLGIAIAWLGGRSFQAPNENDISRPMMANASSDRPTPTPLPPHFPADATETAPIPPNEQIDQSLLSAIERCWSDRHLNDLNPADQFTVLDLEKVFGRIKKQEVLQQKEELELKTGSRRIIELLPDSANAAELKAQISEIDENGINKVVASIPASKAQGSDFKKWRLDSKTIKVERKLGLLFDESLFKGGAAGTATDADGRIQDFQVRADGKILKCSMGAPGGCDCY